MTVARAALMESGGTGGALFRNMYRHFLAECATIVDDDNVRRGHRMCAEVVPLWTEVAHHIAVAGEAGDPASLIRALAELADRERDAMQVLVRTG